MASLTGDRGQTDGSLHCGNWEARLARSLVRSAHETKRRAIIVGAVAAVWLVLTVTGSYLDSNEPALGARIGDAIYNALTFLSPRDAYSGVGRAAPLPRLLWWGRFFGVASSMLTLVWAALYQFRGMIACLLIRSRARGHIIVLSADGFADALARESAEAGYCIVLVERRVSNERIVDLGRAGVVVMPEDASLLHWLHDCRVTSASSVISWADSDSLSLSNAFAARQAMRHSGSEVIVRVDSPEMQRSLRSAPELLQTDEGRLRPVSPTVSAVRAALSGPELVQRSVERGLDRVHVCLHGTTSTLGVIASFMLSHNWSIHLGPPAVTWNAARDRRAWQDWSQHNYCFVEHVDTAFGAEESPGIVELDDIGASEASAFSVHVVDYGDDDRTLAAAFDLASRLAQTGENPTPVQAVLRNAHAVRELLQHSRTLTFADPVLIGAETSFHALTRHIFRAGEARIHQAYARQKGDAALPVAEWRTLGETYVHANRAASDHGSIKEFDMRRARELAVEEQSLIERLARNEHCRWTAERLLDGWAPAARRNNDRRLHDKLVPWDELPQADREKNILAVGLQLEEHLPDVPLPASPLALQGDDRRPLRV